MKVKIKVPFFEKKVKNKEKENIKKEKVFKKEK